MADLLEDLQLLTHLIGHQDNTIELLTLNSNKDSHSRIQNVLKDHFTKESLKLLISDVESDAHLIKKIYPDCSLEEVKKDLRQIGDEQNRVKIILKKLTEASLVTESVSSKISIDSTSTTRRRKFSDDDSHSEHAEKIRKKNKKCIAEELDTTKETSAIEDKLVFRIMDIFPDICSNHIRSLCKGKTLTDINVDTLTAILLSENGDPKLIPQEPEPEETLNFNQQLDLMSQMLPDADPDYLSMHCTTLIDKPDELQLFISQAIETHQYPTMREYERKQKMLTQQKQYTSDFKVENFLEVIPDPEVHFSERSYRNLDSLSDYHYAECFLRNQYQSVAVSTIKKTLKLSKNLREVCKKLEKIKPLQKLQNQRPLCLMPTPTQNIPLLQEIAYIVHHQEISEHIEKKRADYEELCQSYKRDGLVATCQCCFEEDVIMPNIFECDFGCKFCKDCIKRSAEITFGDGKLTFKCLATCDAEFGLQTLQNVLPPKLFSQIASRKQLEEVKSAGVENLEMCSFCNFAAIPAKDDKVFRCFNPDCMKETCRLCKEPSHIPLRCEEVEKDADVKLRTFIEDKMTEALVRKCYKCGMKFIKSEGCNMMTCSCGAHMCYVCNKPITGHQHFGVRGGCPQNSNIVDLHKSDVLKGAEAAKQEISKSSGSGALKSDPTTDIKKYYDDLRKQGPVRRH